METKKYILSQYNEFKTVGDTTVGVNLVNRILFALDEKKFEKLIKYSYILDELKKDDPVFFNTMYKLGVIREEILDENIYEQLLLSNRQLIFDATSYKLTINPTLNCNFKCWYCYETHNNKKMSNEIINSAIKYIENIVSNPAIRNFELSWFGGEPLLCYEKVMKPISFAAKSLCDENNTIFSSGITTNGYLITEEMIPFFRDINMNSFQITLDGNKEVHDTIRYTSGKKPSYDKIVQSITLLADKLMPNNLSLRINYTKHNFDNIENIILSFPQNLRSKITILFQQVWQDKDIDNVPIDKIEDIKYKFQDAGFIVNKDIFNFRGYTCYADKYNEALINYDGRIFKCTATNFEEQEGDGQLTSDGRIIWNDLFIPMRLAKATFENDKCKPCKYLPICFGPCSQKILAMKINKENFDNYCYFNGIETTLDYVLMRFKESNKPIASLLNYRD